MCQKWILWLITDRYCITKCARFSQMGTVLKVQNFRKSKALYSYKVKTPKSFKCPFFGQIYIANYDRIRSCFFSDTIQWMATNGKEKSDFMKFFIFFIWNRYYHFTHAQVVSAPPPTPTQKPCTPKKYITLWRRQTKSSPIFAKRLQLLVVRWVQNFSNFWDISIRSKDMRIFFLTVRAYLKIYFYENYSVLNTFYAEFRSVGISKISLQVQKIWMKAFNFFSQCVTTVRGIFSLFSTFTCSKCCSMGSNEDKSLLFFAAGSWEIQSCFVMLK